MTKRIVACIVCLSLLLVGTMANATTDASDEMPALVQFSDEVAVVLAGMNSTLGQIAELEVDSVWASFEGSTATVDTRSESKALSRTDFTNWNEVCADNPQLEIIDFPLTSDAFGRVTWQDMLDYVTSETNGGGAVVAYQANGSFIPFALYPSSFITPGQHMAWVGVDNRFYLLATIRRTGSGSSSGSSQTWNQIVAENPNVPHLSFPLPSNLNGRVSWQVLSQAMFDEEREIAIIPFGLDGMAIPSDQIDTAMMHVGEHFAVGRNPGICIALGVVESGDPLPELPSELASITWNTFRKNHRDLEVMSMKLPEGSNNLIWLTLMLKNLESNPNTQLLPFETNGRIMNPLDYGKIFLAPGQHMAVFDTVQNKFVGLFILTDANGLPTEPPLPSEDEEQGYPIPNPPLQIANTATGSFLIGLSATHNSLAVSDLISMFRVSDGEQVVVRNLDGTVMDGNATVGTGSEVILRAVNGEEKRCALVIAGDVLGTGTINISQLVRLARALTGTEALTGPYLMAADLNGSGTPDIGDLTMEAKLLTAAL